MILVRAPDQIGEAILSTPALYSLRRGFPGHGIVAVTGPGVGRVFEGTDLVDRVVEYDTRGNESMLLRRYNFFKTLREYRFDLAFDFANSIDSSLMAYVARAGQRVGYDGFGTRSFLTDPVPPLPRDSRMHKAEEFMRLVEMKGAPRSELCPEFRVSEEETETASRTYEQLGLLDKKVIAFDSGDIKSPASWHPERFASALNHVCAETGAKVLILGGEGEIGRLLDAAPVELDHSPSTGEIAALIERAMVHVCNAGTSMHLAAAVGTSVVAVFGPQTPERSGPLLTEGRLIAVTARVACSPCRQLFFQECEPSAAGKPPCLETLKPNAVSAAVLEILS
jgi:heptosyltransferase-2